MLWFNFILGINLIFLCFKSIIIHYQHPKTKENKIKTKLNHNISMADISCEQALRGALAAGREKEGELATLSLEFEFPLQFPCGSPSTELSDFRQSAQSANERECKQTLKNTWQGWWRHYLCHLRQSAFHIVIASSPSCFPPERPRQAIADMASMFIISSSCKCKEETLLFSVACIITMRLLDSLRKKKKRISMYERYLFTFPKADRRKVSSSFNLFQRQIFYKKIVQTGKIQKGKLNGMVHLHPSTT